MRLCIAMLPRNPLALVRVMTSGDVSSVSHVPCRAACHVASRVMSHMVSQHTYCFDRPKCHKAAQQQIPKQSTSKAQALTEYYGVHENIVGAAGGNSGLPCRQRQCEVGPTTCIVADDIQYLLIDSTRVLYSEHRTCWPLLLLL